MQGFLSELSDLGVMLALICIPLATGAIFIPLGRAIAARVRRDGLGSENDMLRSGQVVQRLDRLESLAASIASETQRLGEQLRILARLVGEPSRISGGSSISTEGRVITPH
jgi:hypothetical protein